MPEEIDFNKDLVEAGLKPGVLFVSYSCSICVLFGVLFVTRNSKMSAVCPVTGKQLMENEMCLTLLFLFVIQCCSYL